MSSSNRIKRPAPERTQPIRNWSTLFQVPTTKDGAIEDSEDSDSAPLTPSFNDVVSRSVDLGYRVVDEYIRQGQKAAQRLNDRAYGTETMAGDLQDLALRLTHYASDFAAVWLEFVQVAAAGSVGPKATGQTPDQAPAAAAQTNATMQQPVSPNAPGATERFEPARLRIEVLSTQPTAVSFDIGPEAATLPLVVHALRSVDPEVPRLTDVSLQPGTAAEPARLRIRVPSDQPAGIYSGLVIDQQTSRPVGTVSVRIGAE